MTIYIGIDVGKKSLHIYLPISDKSFELTNNKNGYTKILNYLNKYYAQSLSEIIIVFEPTGGYEKNLREFLKSHKVNFTTVHPNKVRSYAKAKGWLAKTDHIDARLLSDYATVFSLVIKEIYSSENQESLHALIRRREQLMYFKNQESNRLENESNQFIVKSITKHLKYLDKQLEHVQNAIKEVCNNDTKIQDQVGKLISIPGVGITVATTAICEIPELCHIEFNKLTSLVSLGPYARESGNYKGKRSIFAGRSKFRKVLYMAAVASLRCNQKLKRVIRIYSKKKRSLLSQG